MSTTRKVLTIIFSILIIAAFAFVLTWGIINWSKVKDGMAGNGLYTQDDVQNAYEDGFNKALADKDEYEELINGYRDTITTQNDLISQYTSEATALNNSIKDYQGQVARRIAGVSYEVHRKDRRKNCVQQRYVSILYLGHYGRGHSIDYRARG